MNSLLDGTCTDEYDPCSIQSPALQIRLRAMRHWRGRAACPGHSRFNFGMNHIRALFSGAKVTINKLLKKLSFEKLTLEIIGGFACFFARK